MGPERITWYLERYHGFSISESSVFHTHNTIRAEKGYKFQSRFPRHVEDQGMRHIYIKPRSPQLNGKVEKPNRTDQEEFDQLLIYANDVDLNRKIGAGEQPYNIHRPHAVLDGETPCEVLKSHLN